MANIVRANVAEEKNGKVGRVANTDKSVKYVFVKCMPSEFYDLLVISCVKHRLFHLGI